MMTMIPLRACAPLISAIQATITAAAVILPAREIPAATPRGQTAEIIPGLRRMEARPVPTAPRAAAVMTTITVADRRSSSRLALSVDCDCGNDILRRCSGAEYRRAI